MLRCRLDQLEMTPLEKVGLVDAKIRERYDLQKMILKSPGAFFEEIGEPNLLVIGEEVRPSEVVGDHLDILAVDSEDGSLVTIELKRGRDKYQLLQAIHYAAMLAEWTQEDIIRQYADYRKFDQENLEDASQDLRDQEVALELLNRGQRCILIAEDYEPDVLITANWLAQRGVQITCVRIRAVEDKDSQHANGQVCYLDLERIVPPAALEDFFGGRTRRPPVAGTSPNERSRRESHLNFWTDLKKKLLAAGRKWAENRTPSGDHWFSFSCGMSGIHVVASFAQGARLRTEVAIETDDPKVNKEMFDALRKDEAKVAALVKGTLSWERLDERKASRLAVYRDCDREQVETDESYRNECLNWTVERLGEMRKVATDLLR